MTRLEANRHIIELLSKAVEDNPDWRFSQLLVNFKIVEMDQSQHDIMAWKDEFYVESEAVLNRMYRSISAGGIYET